MFTFGSLGLNMSTLVIIVVISELLKKLDAKNKLKKLYVLLPLILSAGIVVLTMDTFILKQYLLSVLTYTSISSYGYTFIKKSMDTLLKKD